MPIRLLFSLLTFSATVAGAHAGAQTPAPPVAPPGGAYHGGLIIEGGAGVARFVDDATIDYAYFSAGCRGYMGTRIALGPGFALMNGPSDARQWHLTATATIDLVFDEWSRQRWHRVIPYVIVAGGYQRMTTGVGTGLFTSSEGSLSAGVGARMALSARLFVAPEVSLGWEPHVRIGASIGWRFHPTTRVF